MEFRELLRELDKIGRTTSRDLARRLGKPVKEISNDLGRLKQMKFAQADREKRSCKLGQWGDVCNRGYQYIYHVSAQGKSYLDWMDKIKPNDDVERKILIDRIAEFLPLDLKKAVCAYYVSRPVRKYRGPSCRSRFLTDVVLTNPVLTFAPSPLELENQGLKEKNRQLEDELEKLRAHARNYESRIKEMEREHEEYEEETKSKLMSAQTEIKNLSSRSQMLEFVLKEKGKIFLESRSILLDNLRKYAPWYVAPIISEYVRKYDETQNWLLERTVAFAIVLSNSQVTG